MRFDVFHDNDHYINNYNIQPEGVVNRAKTVLEHNQFSDWTQAEIDRMLPVRKPLFRKEKLPCGRHCEECEDQDYCITCE